jgi:hypothetical protein
LRLIVMFKPLTLSCIGAGCLAPWTPVAERVVLGRWFSAPSFFEGAGIPVNQSNRTLEAIP